MFASLLKEMITKIDGAQAAAIMGHDGMIVERASNSNRFDLDLVAAEYTSLLRSSSKTSVDSGLGNLQELLIGTDEMTLILRALSPEYFVLIALVSDGNLGRARFELRKAQLILEHEFVGL